MNDETTETLLLRLEAECRLSSAEKATQIFGEYRLVFQSASDLELKRTAAKVLRSMYGKVDAIVSYIEEYYASAILLSQTRAKEELDGLKSWLGLNASTLNSANSFLDRFELIADSRKKIDVVLERLGKVESFLNKKKDETLLSGEWKLDEINKEIERVREASLALETLTKGDAE